MQGHDDMVDDHGVVRIGSLVFALIEPARGRARAFNHWYERDHFYTTGLAAPGVFSAARFIDRTAGWHLALYYVLPGHDAARVAFATEQVVLAGQQGRTFEDREHLHTWTYTVDETWRAATGSVPPALALDHRYPALSVAMFDDDRRGSVAALTARLDASSTAATALILRPESRVMPSTWDGDPDPDRRRIALVFGTDASVAEPGTTTTSLFDDLPGHVWSGSFAAAIIGTDTYVDD